MYILLKSQTKIGTYDEGENWALFLEFFIYLCMTNASNMQHAWVFKVFFLVLKIDRVVDLDIFKNIPPEEIFRIRIFYRVLEKWNKYCTKTNQFVKFLCKTKTLSLRKNSVVWLLQISFLWNFKFSYFFRSSRRVNGCQKSKI